MRKIEVSEISGFWVFRSEDLRYDLSIRENKISIYTISDERTGKIVSEFQGHCRIDQKGEGDDISIRIGNDLGLRIYELRLAESEMILQIKGVGKCKFQKF